MRHLPTIFLLAFHHVFLLVSAASAPLPGRSTNETYAKEQIDSMAQTALKNALAQLDADVAAAQAQGLKPNCTRETLSMRMEFGSIPKEDRQAYTTAISCLQNTKNRTPANISSGARSRYDDFIITHILQTPYVHSSGTFLGWHRHLIHTYEQALRTECGYTGPIPYWDWSLWASAPQLSPIFNGDAYSMGGNGEFIPNRTDLFVTLPPVVPNGPTQIQVIPTGLGGGCVTTGPFGNMTIHLGPGPGSLAGSENITGPENGMGFNPRCLKRDVGPAVATSLTTYEKVWALLQRTDLASFQQLMQMGTVNEDDPITGGVHGGGHFTIAGDPGGDFFVSPGDPAFWLHHAQIDRVWWIWQQQDPENRQYALSGTNTMFNIPPSENTTLDFEINAGYAGGTNVPMRDAMSSVRAEFCFVYV